MTNQFESVMKMALVLLQNDQAITAELIEEKLSQFIVPILSNPQFADVDINILREKLIDICQAKMERARILEGKERRMPWLKELKAQDTAQWHFWEDYKQYLKEVKFYHNSVVSELDHLTDTILDKLFDPTQKNIHVHKKGMVVGQVQSGKTSNYTGLICKAADAGFNFIIVLAGLHNNLRSQTQLRLDEGFLGFDTLYERAYRLHSDSNIGVGKLFNSHDHPVAHSFTTSLEKGDFNKRIAEGQGFNFNTNEPILLVVKKNKSVLTNLFNWITSKIAPEEASTSKSLLVIDDEADNASINTKKNGDPSAINNCIRQILRRFHRVGYVGYTATPFANIFIPLQEDDLFPQDFIINLPTPPNYIGPSRVFGLSEKEDEGKVLPIVQKISDYEDFVPTKHKKDDDMPTYYDMPESLKVAIKSFILTCATRRARGQEHEHNSMLIHISRYQCWQNHIKDLVERLFNYYKEELIYGDIQIIEEFRSLYEEGTEEYPSFIQTTKSVLESDYKDPMISVTPWTEVKARLSPAVKKIEVKSINGSSADVLSYYENKDQGLSAIVIGGDKLSRGLTLEGLSVSYFLRASKMYDTLMQMGRWFGYRPGYADLCRLFTSSELNEWFRHITLASEELRKEFVYLSDIGGTPDNYKLKVRSHPGCLQVTAANKMRHIQTIRVTWAGRLLETYGLCNNIRIKHSNLDATNKFIKRLPGVYEVKRGNYVWRDVTPNLIRDYINQFIIDPNHKTADLNIINKYIERLNRFGELSKWTVAFMGRSNGASYQWTFPNGIKVGCMKRTRANDIEGKTYCIRKGHIISPYDEFVDLSEDILTAALERTRAIKYARDEEWKDSMPAAKVVREEFRSPNNPLLLIYTLDPFYANILDNSGKPISGTLIHNHEDEPFIGFAISFPHTETGFDGIEYTANLIDDFASTENTFDEENDNTDNDSEQE